MALKSSREGLRKELVDYLGNIIIDENLKQNIINSINDVFIDNEELTTSVNELDEKIINESSARESADTTLQENINSEISARKSADTNLSDIKANKSDILTLEEIQASTDLTGKIASASSLDSTYNLISGIFSNDGRQLTSSDDMNNIREGVYRQGGFDTPLNAPSDANNAYILVVKRAYGGGYNQEVYLQIWASINQDAIYIRFINIAGGAYGAWVRL